MPGIGTRADRTRLAARLRLERAGRFRFTRTDLQNRRVNPGADGFLAFDVAGNLWATDVAARTLFEIAKTDLDQQGTSTIAAKVQLSLDSSFDLGRPAFDDQGSLWVSTAQYSFGKLTAQQLAVSSSAAQPTVPAVVISDVGIGPDALAFFPAASGLPLASAQP